ncbi:MAG TPA: ribbon-helix-helix domain-containing protein [Tepidisphaeraceae bacterium]|jgi:hypothetical protein
MKKPEKHPEEMTAAELAEATADFDKPNVFEKARRMSREERDEERRLRRKPPQSRARKISISIEDNLLKKADALARKKGINRAELISSLVVEKLRRLSA